MTENGLTKHFFFSFLTGLVTFGLHRITGQGGLLFEIDSVLLFAICLLAPLELWLIDLPDRYGRRSILFIAAVLMQPFSSVLVLFSGVADTGLVSTILCLPWFLVTGFLFLHGAGRLISRGFFPVSETAIHAGLLFLPVGSFWLLAFRLNFPLLGFDTTFVSLTAVHFHYAGFAALLIVGLLGRKLETEYKKSYRTVVILLICGIPLTAAGIYVSPVIEWLAAIMIVFGLFLFSFTGLRFIKRMFRTVDDLDHRSRAGFVFLSLSLFSVLFSMFFAFQYASGEFFELQTLTIIDMIRIHGWVNALAFSFCGLLAMLLLRTRESVWKPGIPFSKLTWKGESGPDYFERLNLTDPGRTVTGLTDSMIEYNHADFQADSLDHEIRSFYEQTDCFDLTVKAQWQPGFRILSKVYHRFFSSKLQQMNFPADRSDSDHNGADLILSKIMKLKDRPDGRNNVRAWVRWYQATGKAVYSAAYSSHFYQGRPFMNIHFPLPGGGITSILRLKLVHTEELHLTSTENPKGQGDEGVYFVNRWLTVRLPMNETIVVYSAGENSSGNLTATHKMWLFGIHFLTLFYEMNKLPGRK